MTEYRNGTVSEALDDRGNLSYTDYPLSLFADWRKTTDTIDYYSPDRGERVRHFPTGFEGVFHRGISPMRDYQIELGLDDGTKITVWEAHVIPLDGSEKEKTYLGRPVYRWPEPIPRVNAASARAAVAAIPEYWTDWRKAVIVWKVACVHVVAALSNLVLSAADVILRQVDLLTVIQSYNLNQHGRKAIQALLPYIHEGPEALAPMFGLEGKRWRDSGPCDPADVFAAAYTAARRIALNAVPELEHGNVPITVTYRTIPKPSGD